MKKYLSILIAFFMVATVILSPNIGYAEELIEESNLEEESIFSYYVNDNNEATILSFEDGVEIPTKLEIPEEINGYEVIGLDCYAFSELNEIESVILPEGLTSIDDYTFSGCKGLKSISFPDTLKTIGTGAFFDCTSLKIVKIPNKVTKIKEDTFSWCESLLRAEIPSSVTSIEGNPFEGCENLVIYGTKGSKAETLAKNNEIIFVNSTLPEITTFKSISKCKVSDISIQTYKGMPLTPKVTVKYGSTLLTKNKDYLLKYENNDCRGIGNVTVIGIGSYTGSIEKEFVIINPQIKFSSTLTKAQWTRIYVDLATAASTKIVKKSNTFKDGKAVPAELAIIYLFGSGNLDQFITTDGYKVPFSKLISLVDDYFAVYSKASLRNWMNEFVAEQKKYGIGKYDKKNDTYYLFLGMGDWVSYPLTSVEKSGNKIILRGKSYATGVLQGKMKFVIKKTSDGYKLSEYMFDPAKLDAKAKLYGHDDIKVTWNKVSGASGYYVYYKKGSGSYKYLGRTANNYYKKSNLNDGSAYRFKVYPYKKYGEDRYKAPNYSVTSKVYTLKKLNKPSIKKVSRTNIKISWNNISGETGYRIAQSSKKTSGFKYIKSISNKYKSVTLKVNRGKTYYYKVRAYKTVDGEKIYGPWSEVKSYKLK